MRLGTEKKRETQVAIGLMVVAVAVSAWKLPGVFFPSAAPAVSEPSSSAPAPAQPRRTSVKNRRGGAMAPVLSATLDPRLRLDLLQESEHTDYAGTGRNIFRAEAEPPATIPGLVKNPDLAKNQPPPGPPPPPPPPPILLKFFGFASRPGEPKKVFLADGEDVFIAKEGDVVDRHYKVTKIGVNTVEVQDVLTNNVQTLQLAAQG